MIDAALDEPGMRRIADQARAAGFQDVRYAPLAQEAGMVVGWQLDMTSAAASSRAVSVS
jgi:hypothetical protein